MSSKQDKMSRFIIVQTLAVVLIWASGPGCAWAQHVSSGTPDALGLYRPPYETVAAKGADLSSVVGIAIAGSNDHVYAWYLDGTVSSGDTRKLDRYRLARPFNLPPGKTTLDIIDVAIAGSDDRVYAWYRDGTVSSGTSIDLDYYRQPRKFNLPHGYSVLDIVGIGIRGSDDTVITWYENGKYSEGNSTNLYVHNGPESYAPAWPIEPKYILAVGIAGSNDHAYAFYQDCVPGISTQLPVRLWPQETNLWCWAASSQMIMDYFARDVSQCTQANDRFSQSTCCSSPQSAQCRKAGEISIRDYAFTANILKKFTGGKTVPDPSTALSWSKLMREIATGGSCRGRPHGFSWQWWGGGSHVMVVSGYIDLPLPPNLKFVTVHDPWPVGTGDVTMYTYDYFKHGEGHHRFLYTYHDIDYTGNF